MTAAPVADAPALTPAQQAQVDKSYPECRKEMAAYLAAGARVVIEPQREVPEAAPFAIVVERTDFWIDCCPSVEEARELCRRIGLVVV
ncbi:hypothetical protein ABIC83_002387 [Roseateles asaccharophilus]|uniref:hypothetical protein n=1 Tax=Roseateles asaccharophilus TaxID=582607 RepID=UPI003834DE8D